MSIRAQPDLASPADPAERYDYTAFVPRCQECGARLQDANPVCQRHGPRKAKQAASELETDADREPDFETGDIAGISLEQQIAVGGFGCIYRAKRCEDGRPLAVKFALNTAKGAVSQLHAERDALERLRRSPDSQEPHVVPELVSHGESSTGQPYLAMEFLQARMLSDILAEASGASLAASFPALARALVRSVAQIARKGIVHRDLKPENVFVCDDGEVLVFDFGMAFVAGETEPDLEAEWVGTPEYMSPEQCEPEREVGLPSDIYALGVILYEMLAGHPPFIGSESELREQHLSRRPPNLARFEAVYRGAAEVIHRCLAKDPTRRFASADVLFHALDDALQLDEELAASSRTKGGPEKQEVAAEPESDKPKRRGRKGKKRSRRERQMVGLLWIYAQGGVGPITQALSDSGGHVAQTSGELHVIAFGHECGDNPVRSALYGARRLVSAGVEARIIVDVAAVMVQTRASGARTYVDPGFSKPENFPQATDPEMLMITSVASELVPETDVQQGPRDGVLNVPGISKSTQATAVRETSAEFYGHSELRERLLSTVEQALAGEPVVISIEAEAGLGKSLLASELARKAARKHRELRVEALRALEPVASVVTSSVDELLKRLLNLPAAQPPDGGHSYFAAVLGEEFAREVGLGLRIALNWVEADAQELEALRAAPGALRSTTSIAVGRTLRQLAETKALGIVVDDAHYADEALLDALEFATLREAGAKLWVCLLARPALQAARPTIGARASCCERLQLPPLDEEAAGEFARKLLMPARSVPVTAISMLFERTRGVPILLVELIRGLRRDGVLRPSERGKGWYLATDELEALPALPAVQWLASCELDALPAQLVAHARIASILGSHFSDTALEGVLSGLEALGVSLETQLDASIGIDRLCKAGVLIREGRSVTRFRHALLRDTLYAQVEDELKLSAHGVAFEFFAAEPSMAELERLSQIAVHASGSKRSGPAANAYLKLAEAARDRHAYVEAETLFAHSLSHLADDDQRRCRVGWAHGMMRFRVGRNEDAIRGLEAAMKLAEQSGDSKVAVAVLLDLAMVLDWQDELERSAELVRKADEASAGDRDALMDAKIQLGHGRAAFRANDFSAAVELTLAAAEASETMGDDGYETHVVALLLAGVALGLTGEHSRCEATIERAILAAQARGDSLHLGTAYQNRAIVWVMQQKPEPLLADLERVMEISRETGSSALEGRAVYNLGEVCHMVGDYEAASEHATRSIELYSLMGGAGGRTLVSQLLLARVLAASGEYERAGATIREMRAAQAQCRDEGRADSELVASDAVLAEIVELLATQADETAWEELIARAEHDSVQAEIVEVLEFHALAQAARGQLDEARLSLGKALARAEEIPNLMGPRLEKRRLAFEDMASVA